MNENAGPYQSMDRFECRKKIVEDMQNEGLLDKIESYSHAVGIASAVRPLSNPSPATVVRQDGAPGKTGYRGRQRRPHQDRSREVYQSLSQLDGDIRDWCISRSSGGAIASRSGIVKIAEE